MYGIGMLGRKRLQVGRWRMIERSRRVIAHWTLGTTCRLFNDHHGVGTKALLEFGMCTSLSKTGLVCSENDNSGNVGTGKASLPDYCRRSSIGNSGAHYLMSQDLREQLGLSPFAN
jgi:hypothetical protein